MLGRRGGRCGSPEGLLEGPATAAEGPATASGRCGDRYEARRPLRRRGDSYGRPATAMKARRPLRKAIRRLRRMIRPLRKCRVDQTGAAGPCSPSFEWQLTGGHFPTDEAATKMMRLARQNSRRMGARRVRWRRRRWNQFAGARYPYLIHRRACVITASTYPMRDRPYTLALRHYRPSRLHATSFCEPVRAVWSLSTNSKIGPLEVRGR